MKKFIFCAVLIIAMALVAIGGYFTLTVSDDDYFAVLDPNGVSNDLAEQNLESATEISDGIVSIPMDGYAIRAERADSGGCRVLSVSVTDPKYRFRRGRVGVGDEADKVKKAYRGRKQIADLPENEFGFIDGEIWVRFKTENGAVSEINLSYGP